MTTPYAEAAATYWNAGWRAPLPLPPRKKAHPPTGYTGASGGWPSYPDIFAWVEDKPDANICLRLPVDVIGVDVDHYDGKKGGDTLTSLEAELGTLEDTWRSTSRDDGISGIRLFRAPAGMSWEDFGDDIEVIHTGWRYLVAWPSIHPEGRTYRWVAPGGVISTTIPAIDDLPMLPSAWVERFSRGPAEDINRNTLDAQRAAAWLVSLPGAAEDACKVMRAAAESDAAKLGNGSGSAHDHACSAIARVVRLAAEGHHGALNAAEQIKIGFTNQVTDQRRNGRTRTRGEAAAEWSALLISAVNLVSLNLSDSPSCDCNGQLTDLIVGTRDYQPDPAKATDGNTALATEPASDTPTTTEPDEDPATDHTTWWPRNLSPILSGEVTDPPPTILQREDGQPLWYRGKVNGLLGESESGKTWVALEAVRQVITRGGRCLYLDFEDAAPGIVTRLRALGIADTTIGAYLTYVDPAEDLHPNARADLAATVNVHHYDLIVVDGVNAAMTLLGYDLLSNADATAFAQKLLKPLAATGAAVAYVDHIPKNSAKNDTNGGIGAQAKRAMTTGCVLKARVIEPFGKGLTGRLGLSVDKDRAGHVRGASAGAKDAGTVVLTSADDGGVTVVINTPDLTPSADRSRGKADMRREAICEFIATCDDEPSTGTVKAAVVGKDTEIIADLAWLEQHNYITDRPSSVGHRWSVVRPFTIADQLSTGTRSPVPTHSQPVPGTGGETPGQTRSPVPTPLGGNGTGSGDGGRKRVAYDGYTGNGFDPETGEVI